MVKRYDVFLSYSSVDVEQATSLAARLKDNGVTVFLSIWDLVSGRPWQDDLEAALDNSDRVAVLVGSSGLNPWHRHEVRVAVNRAVRAHDDFRVIPVLLPGAQRDSLPDFLTQFTEVDLRDGIDGDEKFAQLVAAIRDEPPAGLPNRSLPDEPAPYPRLSAFNRHQTRFFFGRDDDIRRLAGRVLGNSATFLMGASR